MSGHALQRIRATVRKALWVAAPAAVVGVLCVATAEEPTSQRAELSGRELFHREWLPNDPRSHGGDGLGPVFNDSSCVACHNLGGSGGGGPFSKNVELLTKLTNVNSLVGTSKATQQQRAAIEKLRKQLREKLIALHPGFRDSDTVVIHRFGTDPKHEEWRLGIRNRDPFASGNAALSLNDLSNPTVGQLPTRIVQEFEEPQQPSFAPSATPADQPAAAQQAPRPTSAPTAQQLALFAPTRFGAQTTSSFGMAPVIQRAMQDISRLKQSARSTSSTRSLVTVALQFSQRNTTALFGVGLIDQIPDEAIEAVAKLKYEDFPHVSGRVHRMKDRKIGRFGWKAQKAALYDFTMAACGVELGLHVPDHPQAEVPYKSKKKPQGFDLTQKEVNALVGYLRQLPAPTQQKTLHAEAAKRIDEGKRLFGGVGCAACHVQKLSSVDGLFSDLLLHDMGPEMGGSGHYGVSPQPSPPDDGDDAGVASKKFVGPSATEWKTPPLWGCRDSAPYLHDGRAATLEQAIAFHGGEAADSTIRYFMLSPRKRQLVVAFLKTLVAPDSQR